MLRWSTSARWRKSSASMLARFGGWPSAAISPPRTGWASGSCGGGCATCVSTLTLRPWARTWLAGRMRIGARVNEVGPRYQQHPTWHSRGRLARHWRPSCRGRLALPRSQRPGQEYRHACAQGQPGRGPAPLHVGQARTDLPCRRLRACMGTSGRDPVIVAEGASDTTACAHSPLGASTWRWRARWRAVGWLQRFTAHNAQVVVAMR